ncbi:MAG: holo-ACP synthase [Polyangiales bacterium]
MIVGLGIDVVGVARIERLIERWGERIEARVLTEPERVDAPRTARRAEWIAGRIAAKEAGLKALGVPDGVGWQSVEVVSARPSPPGLRFHGAAKSRAESMAIARAHVSITHDGGVAAAVVVLEA